MNERHRQLREIEIAALESLCALATPVERDALGLYCERHDGALVLACRAEQGILFNRTVGLDAEHLGKLDDILDVYRRYAIGRAFVSVDGTDARVLLPALQARGLVPARAWCKFTRDAQPAPTISTDLDIRVVGGTDGEAFARIVCNAFDLPPGFIAVLSRLPEQPGWTVFMSFDGAQPTGGGALFQHGEQAWLGFGATDPAFRRRGSQGAIVAARVAHAVSNGARLLSTETGEAVPGDPQHSWKNIEKSRFVPEYRILNYAFNTTR